jgi:predicted deacetylase
MSLDARVICVVLHDVAPARWSGCQQVLNTVLAVARLARVRLPVSLLVVPQWHGDAALPRPYLRWLWCQVALGHELVLHGLTHLDEGPRRHPLDSLRRRFALSAGEGEFAALDGVSTRARCAAARAWAAAVGLPTCGFVPPAWLVNRQSLSALFDSGFAHVSTARELIALPERQAVPVRRIGFASRSAWRRSASRLWLQTLNRPRRDDAVWRLDLHPDDAEHDSVRRTWMPLLAQALQERNPMLLRELADTVRMQ